MNRAPYRCGIAALAGRPNVGKSCLMNRLLEYKVSIVSDKPQTTRNNIRCIYTGEGFQAVFLDTPGIHLPKHRLGRTLMESATKALNEADLICYVVEMGDSVLTSEDEEVLRLLGEAGAPVLLVMNKADLAKRKDAERTEVLYGEKIPLLGAVPVSARTGEGIDALLAAVRDALPAGEAMYDDEMIVDRPEKFIVAEILREKVLLLSHQEVPHNVVVGIEEYKSPDEYPDRTALFVRATLYVEREGQKRIIIGRGGARLKEIGRLARLDVEALTGHKTFLDLWVKVRPGWRESEADLRLFGIKERTT